MVGTVVYARNQQKKIKRELNALRLQDRGTTVTHSDPAASRRLIYGRVRIGGITCFLQTTGTNKEYLHMVIALAKRPLAEIGETYFGNDSLLNPWGSGNAPDPTSRYYGYVRINKNRGETGLADADLVAESGGVWTADHKMVGVPNLYVRLKWDQDIFPSGQNFNISTDVIGHDLYDPRGGSDGWSNPALVLRDYLTQEMKVSPSEIDEASFIEAANVCDEEVTLSDGSTGKRYEFNGMLDTATPPPENRRIICSTMAGWCAKIAGKWRVRAGSHVESSASFTLDDFRGPIDWQPMDPVDESCNGVIAQYLSPLHNWQVVNAPHYIKRVTAPNITAGARVTIIEAGTTDFTLIGAPSNDVDTTFTATGPGTGTGVVDPYLGADNGRRKWLTIQLDGTTSEAQAIRLMRIALEKARHDLTCIAPMNWSAYRVQAGDTIDITEPRYGWTNKLFTVLRHKRVREEKRDEKGNAGIALGCDLYLRETSPEVWERTTAEETTADPAPNTDLPKAWEVEPPSGLTLESGTVGLVAGSDGTIISRIKASWTLAPDQFVQSGGFYEIQYRTSMGPGNPWMSVADVLGDESATFIGPLIDGDQYDVRIRSNNRVASSEWVESLNHTVVGKSEDPNVATNLTATALAGGVLFQWDNPSDPDLKKANLWFSASNTFPGGAPDVTIGATPGSKGQYRLEPLTGGSTRYGWVATEDSSGNPVDKEDTVIGPANATATSGTAGSDGYTISLSMESPQVRCDSAGTPLSGELGGSGRVNTTVEVMKGNLALTATTGTPGAGQFRIVKILDTDCTTTFSAGYIELTTVSADAGDVSYKIELESTSVFLTREWDWVKTKNGTNGTGAVTVYITAPAQAFTRANSGASYSPSTITLTAALIGATATTWAWQYWNGASWTAASGTNNASTYVVSSGDFSGSRTYRCEINSAYANDEYELYHITGGADGTSPVLAVLDNQVHAVPASSAGVVSSWTNAGGNFKVQVGNVDVTTSATFSILTNASSLTASIGSTTGIYSVTGAGSWANASLATEIVFRAVYLGVNYDRAFRLTKTLTGATGTGAPGNYVVRRYMASSTVPSTPSSVNAPAGWTTSMPTPAGNQVVFFVEAYFDGSTNNITGAWSTPVRVPGAATFYATSFPAGIIAAGDYCFRTDQGNTLYQYDGSTWVDRSKVLTQADFGTGIRPVQLVTSLPSLPSATYPVGSVVLNTTDSQLYENKAGSWSKVIVDTASLTGTISAAQIAAGAITAGKIAANAVTAGTIAAGVVTASTVGTNQIIASAANIADAIITSAKIVSLDAGKLTAGTINAVISLTTGGEFVAGTGDSQLRATTTGTTIGNTTFRHVAFPTSISGTTQMQVRVGSTPLVTVTAVSLGGADWGGNVSLYNSITGTTGSLTPNALSLAGSTAFLELGFDAKIQRTGSYAIGINSATSFTGGSLAQRNSANTYDNFKVTQDTAVDVTGVNLRIFNSSGTQKARFDNVTGDLYLAAGAKIYINNVVVVS